MHVCRLHGNELNYGNAQLRKKTNAGYNFVLYIFTNIYFWPNVVFCVCVWGFLCVCKAYIYTSAKIPKTQILKKHLLLFVGPRDEGRKVQCTGGDHTHTHKHTHPHQRHNAGHRLCIGIGGLCENTAVCVCRHKRSPGQLIPLWGPFWVLKFQYCCSQTVMY